MVIAIDFDGTIVDGDNHPEIGDMAEGAKEAIRYLKSQGHYIIIHTCRSNNELVSAINFLVEHEIPFDRVNDNHPEHIARYRNNSRKIFADLYIDDRNLGGFPGWDFTLSVINDSQINHPSYMKQKMNIETAACDVFEIPRWKLSAKTKITQVLEARQVCMWYRKKFTKASYKSIGLIYARDHATALHATKTVDEQLSVDREFTEKVTRILKMLGKQTDIIPELKKPVISL